MKLADYLEMTKSSASALADSLGVQPPTVHRYLTGERIPTRAVMSRIVAHTKGAVQPNDFYSDPAE